MERKSTDDLHQELQQSADLASFLRENVDHFEDRGVPEMLNELLETHGLSKAALAKNAGMSDVYIHQIFSGRRNPSRNRLICLALGASATLEEAQELLRRGGYSKLYPRVRKDAIILYGLEHRLSLVQVNEKLFDADEETLC